MAKVTLDLNQFKASGVYTVEFDATESVVLNTQTIRLVVGFSKRGPINAPVFLRDIKSARKIFGIVDTSLEKNGSFFHRSIETALQTGPIYALNLRALDNTPDGDKVEFQSFSLDSAEQNPSEAEDLLVSFYNTEKFWRPDTDYFNAVVNNNYATKGKLMSFVNLNSSPMSIFVQKSNIKGFDITAREYFGEGNVPDFIRSFDFISDYFLEVIMLQGDWTDYGSLSLDPVYQQWFDSNGLIKGQLENFLSAEETTTIGSFVGTIIPDFIDGNGVNQYLETIINNAFGATGIYMNIDRNILEDDYDTATSKVDLIGHNLIDSTNSSIDFISYVAPISEKIEATTTALSDTLIEFKDSLQASITSTAYGDDRSYFNNVLNIKKPAPSDITFSVEDYDNLALTLTNISLLKTAGTDTGVDDYVKVETVVNTGATLAISYSHPTKPDTVYDFTVDSTAGSPSTLTLDSAPTQTYSSGDMIYSSDLETYYTVTAISGSDVTIEEDGTSLVGKEILLLDSSSSVDQEVKISADELNYILSPSVIADDVSSATDNFTYVYPGNALATSIKNNIIIDGDRIYKDATGEDIWWISISEVEMAYGLIGYEIRQYMDSNIATQANTTNFIALGSYYLSSGTIPVGPSSVYYSSYGNIEKNVALITNTLAGSHLEFKIGAADATDIEVGNYLVTEDLPNNVSHLTKVIDKIKTINQLTGNIEYTIKTNERVKITEVGSPIVQYVTRYLPIQDFVQHLQPSSLTGFTLNRYHLPNGTVTQQEKIYNVIDETGLKSVLSDKDQIQFRYIVDTFEGAIAPNMGPKTVLTGLAKSRAQCLAFINAPSVKQLSNSTDPRFTDVPDPANGIPKPIFQSSYIPVGGNLSLGPSFRLTLPTEEQGSKYMGIFSPNLLIRENNKNLSIPPAACASNNFIEKFVNGQPYSIVAGPRRGIISTPNLIGTEYEYDKDDRNELEPFGWNPIIVTKNTGPMIYSNATAFQKTRSALNNLHVRDLLITIEENIEEILSFYVWEFNDARTRLEIKTLVDRYLSVVQNGQGIYDFLTIMDETNNTSEVIDQNVGIIDVGIEPARGLQKIINRITVLKTGTISSGGFTIA